MNAMIRRGRAVALLPFVAAMSGAAAVEADAAGACYPREAIIAHLAERYGERPVAAGVAQGQLVLLFRAPMAPAGLFCWSLPVRVAASPVSWRWARTGGRSAGRRKRPHPRRRRERSRAVARDREARGPA
jgi:hypothetical protein